MTALRMSFIFLLCFTASTFIWTHLSYSETAISELTLTGDVIFKEIYQPGSGLPVGKIQLVRGEAIVYHRDSAEGYRIQPGLPMYVGDSMRTHGTAWILCRLIDGSHIVLTPQTTLTILQSSHNSVRKTMVSFLHLKHGSARFKLNPMPELSSYDFKVRTAMAFTSTKEADFVVKATLDATDIIAFEKSRLEVTGMAQPEDVIFLSDFQRVSVTKDDVFPAVETLSLEDIETIMADFRPAPPRVFFSAGAKKSKQDHITDEILVEEDIVEEQPQSVDTD